MPVKTILMLAALMSVSACSSYTPPPEPFGPKVPVNGAIEEEEKLQTAAAGSEVRHAVLLDDELNAVRRTVDAADNHQAEDTSLGLKDVKQNWFRK